MSVHGGQWGGGYSFLLMHMPQCSRQNFFSLNVQVERNVQRESDHVKTLYVIKYPSIFTVT